MSQCGGLQDRTEGVPADVNLVCRSVTETVLLVEDEPFVREAACDLLECHGYEVLKARNADQARTLFRRNQNRIRLLLSDVVLPDKNGCDLAQSLRALAPDLRVIFISGYFDNPYTRRPERQPGTFYLPKPFSAEALIGKVSRVLLGTEREDTPSHAYGGLQTA